MDKYKIGGMSCAACSARIEKAVKAVEGVDTVSVSLLTNTMGVEGTVSPEMVITAVKRAGYGAALLDANQNKAQSDEGNQLEDKQTPKLRARLIISVCFLIPLMYVSMGHMMWGWPLPKFFAESHVAIGLLQLILTTIIMVINQQFFISGFMALARKSPNMDTLVALGSSAAFIYSTVLLFQLSAGHGEEGAHDFYFESAAMILTLITLGKMLEAYSKGKTTNALKGLMKIAPKTATLLIDGKEEIVSIDRVKRGDIFVVRSGESIPADGVIISGDCAIDESALTGESIPVDKGIGDSVSAATISLTGYITCRAVRIGKDTTLAQIIQMVSDAAATKAPIAKVADKVSGIFVPVVIAIALVTIAAWMIVGKEIGFALARGISVLVISCPCALGLATPVAIMVGNGKGARNGILFKTASSLEEAGKVSIVALDKTGTITYGTPKVTDIIKVSSKDSEELLKIACSLEYKSEHPLAKAIIEYATSIGIVPLDTEQFIVVPGNGLSAVINGLQVYGGNASFIGKYVELSAETLHQANNLSQEGKTPLFFGCGDRLLGIIAVADVVKESAENAINELKSMGIDVVMLTGDNELTAKAIGRQIGIDHVVSDVFPSQKEEQIRLLSKKGKVAMVGDGINDAPALTSADVGIAIGAGTDIAIDAADIVLVKSAIEDIPAAIRLSRKVLRNIHENLFWAFFYNVIGIPLAAGVWIPLLGWQLSPMFGAAAMSLSSFCVVMNALRLNTVKIYKEKAKENELMKNEILIEGMMCAHCEGRVKSCLEAMQEVASAEVSHKKGTAIVTLRSDVSDETITKVIEGQGYNVKSIKSCH